MKNVFLREATARDINEQVAKVLRDLGNPSPPLNLDDVRDLLKLDRNYYTSNDDSALREVTHRLIVAGKQVIARPMFLMEAIKKFDLRALLVVDHGRRQILIDKDLPAPKQRWSEGHEIGHDILPWHSETMLGDNRTSLTPSCHAQIENEANFAAGQMLFFQDAFVQDSRDLNPSINGLKTLGKKYGNTFTTTLWRFVEQCDEPMVGCISCHPHRLSADFNASEPLKYFVESRKFQTQFSRVSEVALFKQVKGYCANRSGGPLGEADLVLQDDSGVEHLFHFETFFNQHDALTLGVYKHSKSIIVAAG